MPSIIISRVGWCYQAHYGKQMEAIYLGVYGQNHEGILQKFTAWCIQAGCEDHTTEEDTAIGMERKVCNYEVPKIY